MNVAPGTKKLIYLVWFLTVPLGLFLTYTYAPAPKDFSIVNFLGFLLLGSVVAFMPLVINGTPVFLIQWVSIAVFLRYGLFYEMITVQVSVLVLLTKLRLSKESLFRLPLNSVMFFTVSLISGLVYFRLGGTLNPKLADHDSAIKLATAYAFINYLLNQLIIIFFQKFIYKSKESYFGKDFVWESLTTVITFPLGFVLYMLNKDLDLLSLLFIGGPFVSVSLIVRMYYSTQNINEYLQKAADIGHQLAERKKTEEVTDLLLEKLAEMLPIDYAYLIDIQDNDEHVLIRQFDHGVIHHLYKPLISNQGINGTIWESGKPLLFGAKKEWRHLASGTVPEDAESVLGIRMMKRGKSVGILLLGSKRKRAYESSQPMIVDILCSHYAIAVENARHYEQAKEESERCSLTKLHNYRYFERLLTSEFGMLQSGFREKLALIILDIDHFKSVNDTYGHQSGNEVLRELAIRIEKIVGDAGTVARYGGEEFVIFLPDTTSPDAYNLAELIRQSIANWPFLLQEHLEGGSQQLSIRITASFGVATAPEDADDPLALIRHADRALYVGAKRAGRNRVAAYVK